MQKFEESSEALSERRNIVVMADEAHRGQYGLTEKVVVKKSTMVELEAKTIIGTARIIRDSLPNATYIGFTGTPISSKDRSTREVFGNYIDIYDMITPHEYSGILTNDNRIVSKLLLNMNEYCAMEKIISVFIRLNPYLAEQIHCFKETGYEVSCVTKQVMVRLQQSEDALLQAYDSSTKT